MTKEEALAWADNTATTDHPGDLCAKTLAAEVRRLTEENERLHTVPMKYRRMEHNAALQKQADEYRDVALEWKARAEAAEKERDHWKANHADMVKRNRLLHDRPDLGDRAASVQKLIQERDEYKEKWETAQKYFDPAMKNILDERNDLRERLKAAEEEIESLHKEGMTIYAMMNDDRVRALGDKLSRYEALVDVTSYLLHNIDNYGVKVVRDMEESIASVAHALAALKEDV